MRLLAMGSPSPAVPALPISNSSSVESSQQAAPLPPSHKWRMVIAYDGTRFSGWQYQQAPPTVQFLIEKALLRVTKLDRKELCLVGASRTDTGVHAWGQVAHFVTPFAYDGLESLHAGVNGLLPPEIRVREISPAPPEFHARFSAISKTYHYKIYNNPTMNPFQSRYALHSAYKLNPVSIREAATYLIGKHDFSSFANASNNDRLPNPVKDILRFDVVEQDDVLQLEVEGTSFLYKQVRNMVALLIEIGKEALPPDIVPTILAAHDRRELAKITQFSCDGFVIGFVSDHIVADGIGIVQFMVAVLEIGRVSRLLVSCPSGPETHPGPPRPTTLSESSPPSFFHGEISLNQIDKEQITVPETH